MTVGMFRKRWRKASDPELMRALAKGSEPAFAELLRRYQGGVLDFACRFLGDADEARDVAQETFLRLYRNAEGWRPEAGLRAWLYKIAKNLCIDHVRKKRPDIPGTLPEPVHEKTPLDTLNGKELTDTLSRGIGRLPESQRTAVLLRHTEGFSYAEIAESMGTSVSAVESLLVRGRKRLRLLLAGN